MKYDVYLLNYNNYYNRQVKKLNTIAEYISASNGYFLNEAVQNINFAFGDGLNSELIINQTYVNKQPDYVIIEERDHEAGVEGKFSRWFIIDSNLTRGGQYHFTIKRDICADYNNLFLNSTYFLERGYVNSSNNLIFNDEEQKYSQIKKSQLELRDETYGPWIIGYIPRKINGEPDSPGYSNPDRTIKGVATAATEDITVANITQESWYQYTTNYVASDADIAIPYALLSFIPVVCTGGTSNIYGRYFYEIDLKNMRATNDPLTKPPYGNRPNNVAYPYLGDQYPEDKWANPATGFFMKMDATQSQFNTYKSNLGWYLTNQLNAYNGIQVNGNVYLNTWCSNMANNGLAYSQMMSQLKSDLPVNLDNATVDYINNNLRGKSIKDTATGKKYTILVEEVEEFEKLTISSTLNTRIRFLMPSGGSTQFGTTTKTVEDSTVKNNNLQITYHVMKYKIKLQEAYGVQTILPKDDTSNANFRQHLEDAPYDMFAIPYSDRLVIKTGVNTTLIPNTKAGMAIANGFVTTLGDAMVYDIQVLPYCPVRQFIKSDGSFDITAANSTQVQPIVDSANTDTILNYVFYCSSSQMENIKLLNKDDNLNPYSIVIENYKESVNLDMYRLCSPNFASIFEFSPAKNDGVEYFEFSASYKPYNPYIKVKPHFNRLYGTNDRDARGLILQGDFSIPTMSSAWANYELQNKNYLNTFNREIQSLELQNEVAGVNDVWKALSGTIQGAASGAMAGGITAGPYGAIAGAVVGGVSSAIGGGVDIYNNARLRNDALDKANDLFKYNLQNIKALPYSIRNVGCLTADNLLVPLLEYYSASDEEKDAFNKKIQYYGMSVNKVCKIIDFINANEESFVKGYLIRLNPVNGVNEEVDNHLAEAISEEISKGLYIDISVIDGG